jgi:hypothetical protein
LRAPAVRMFCGLKSQEGGAAICLSLFSSIGMYVSPVIRLSHCVLCVSDLSKNLRADCRDPLPSKAKTIILCCGKGSRSDGFGCAHRVMRENRKEAPSLTTRTLEGIRMTGGLAGRSLRWARNDEKKYLPLP